MAAARKEKSRARSSSARVPVLEQRHLRLLGLALVGLSAFLAFVLYGGWQGGRAGEGIVEGLGWLIGRIRYLAPVGFAAAGVILVLRPVLPAARPLRPGGARPFPAPTPAPAPGPPRPRPRGGRRPRGPR